MDIVKALKEIKEICRNYKYKCDGCPFNQVNDNIGCFVEEIPSDYKEEDFKCLEKKLEDYFKAKEELK